MADKKKKGQQRVVQKVLISDLNMAHAVEKQPNTATPSKLSQLIAKATVPSKDQQTKKTSLSPMVGEHASGYQIPSQLSAQATPVVRPGVPMTQQVRGGTTSSGSGRHDHHSSFSNTNWVRATINSPSTQSAQGNQAARQAQAQTVSQGGSMLRPQQSSSSFASTPQRAGGRAPTAMGKPNKPGASPHKLAKPLAGSKPS